MSKFKFLIEKFCDKNKKNVSFLILSGIGSFQVAHKIFLAKTKNNEYIAYDPEFATFYQGKLEEIISCLYMNCIKMIKIKEGNIKNKLINDYLEMRATPVLKNSMKLTKKDISDKEINKNIPFAKRLLCNMKKCLHNSNNPSIKNKRKKSSLKYKLSS